MDEGRQIEVGSTREPSDKVVRLPRDWLGPREHLVPFGQSTPPAADPDLAAFAPDDFWGERAAAIHAAVQAPEAGGLEHPPTGEPAPKVRVSRRRLHASAAAGVAALAAVVFLLGGSPGHVTGGPRPNSATILSSGVSRILKGDLPRIVARTPTPRIVRHLRHRATRPKLKRAQAEHDNSPAAASTYVARASSPSPQPTYHPSVSSPAPRIVTSSHPAESAASSRATVSPTGQNGALGPVQSPNG